MLWYIIYVLFISHKRHQNIINIKPLKLGFWNGGRIPPSRPLENFGRKPPAITLLCKII